MKQIPFSFARAGWSGQRPMSRMELEERRKRIEAKARALHLASLSPRERAQALAKEQPGEMSTDDRQMILPNMGD